MFEWILEIVTVCWADVVQMKPSRLCYAVLFGLYLTEATGVHDRRLLGLAAAMYLVLYLA